MNEVLNEGVKIQLFISLEMDKLHKMHYAFEFSCDGKWFNELVKPMVDARIDYTCEVIWTNAWHHSIAETCNKYDEDLIIVSEL